MQYDVNTPDEYLDALEDDWRKRTLLQIRELILRTEPDIEESIQYKMLAYGLKGTDIFALNAQKGYVSLYVGDIHKIDPDGSMLTGLNLGKGCIRFRKSDHPEKSRIEDFIKRTILLAREGKDIDC